MGWLDAIIPGLGTVLGAGTRIFQAHLEHKQKIELAKLDIEIAKIEAEAGLQEINVQKEIEEIQAQANLEQSKDDSRTAQLVAGMRNDSLLQSDWAWVNAIRALTRPLLTWFLLISSVALAFVFDDIRVAVVQVVLTGFSSSLSFWFVDRIYKK